MKSEKKPEAKPETQQEKPPEKKSEIILIYEKYKNKEEYNKFMQNLFSGLSKKDFSFLLGTSLTKDGLINNFQNNVNALVNHIYQLNENEEQNKDIYNCLSCIFGAFLGDATGAYCEFKGPNMNNIKKIFVGKPMFGDDPGQITDDSEMGIANAFALMDNPKYSDINSDYCFYFYGLWHSSKPKDEGITTRKALKNFKASDFIKNENNYTAAFQEIKKNNSKSMANGFLMRTSPFIVWCYFRFKNQIENIFKKDNDNHENLFKLFEIIRDLAYKDNICTHPNDSLCISHSIFAIMSFGAICELKPAKILNIIEELLKNDFFNKNKNTDTLNIKNMIINELDNYKKDEKKLLGKIENSFQYFTKGDKNVNTHMGFYFHAFRLTLYFLYYFDEIKGEHNFTKFRTIINQICAFGGDTDTNAAIVGTVIGPLIGYKKFGDAEFKKMVSLVPNKRFIFSPALMIIYVYFIKDYKNIDDSRRNFLKMLLMTAFKTIDVNHLNNIFTYFD